MLEKKALARPGGSNNRKSFAGLDLEVYILEDMIIAKRLVEPFNVQADTL